MRGRPRRTTPDPRAAAMLGAFRDGKTLHEIGAHYGITRERVRQILSKYTDYKATDGGASIRWRQSESRRVARKDAISFKKWGCSYADYKILRAMKGPTRAFIQQRSNAHRRGIGWELSLAEWWRIWCQSGQWENRGRGNCYMMCRKGDLGPYAVDNVFIARGIENASQANNKSGLPMGVYLKRGRFVAHRQIEGKNCYLGAFRTAELAHAAYVAADPFERVAA